MKENRDEKRVYLEKLKAYEKRLLQRVKPKTKPKK
jgi:hypothetical protein